jgi:hypothetical protein
MSLATRESCKWIIGCKRPTPDHPKERHKVVQTAKRMTLKRLTNVAGTDRGKTKGKVRAKYPPIFKPPAR